MTSTSSVIDLLIETIYPGLFLILGGKLLYSIRICTRICIIYNIIYTVRSTVLTFFPNSSQVSINSLQLPGLARAAGVYDVTSDALNH